MPTTPKTVPAIPFEEAIRRALRTPAPEAERRKEKRKKRAQAEPKPKT
jgi:hypothetical protein